MRWILTTTLICVAGLASADDAAKTQARAHFRAGTAFYEAGDYDKAIAEYQAAYDILPLPDLLFNLGQAYRLKADSSSARSFYQRYLEKKPAGPVADEAREHLRELTPPAPSSAPVDAAPAPSPASIEHAGSPSTNTPPSPRAAAPAQKAPTSVEVQAGAAHTAAPPADARRQSRRRWLLPVTLVGSTIVVGVAIGVGVGLGTAGTRYPAATFGETMPR